MLVPRAALICRLATHRTPFNSQLKSQASIKSPFRRDSSSSRPHAEPAQSNTSQAVTKDNDSTTATSPKLRVYKRHVPERPPTNPNNAHQGASGVYRVPTTALHLALEDLSELAATVQDEYEIALSETESRSAYAAVDRQAAREELAKLLLAYEAAVKEHGEEVQSRMGEKVERLKMAIEKLDAQG